MSTLLKVRPTKIEFIRLRRRLHTARRVQKILSDRLTILVNEFMISLRETLEKRYLLLERLTGIYRRAEVLSSIYGSSIREYLYNTTSRPEIYIGTENIMGVKIKTPIVRYSEDPGNLPPGLEEFCRESRELVTTILELTKLEYTLRELGREISATKRKANALQYVIIPRLKNTIRYLQLKFDEREREEKARLKRIKQVLSRRKSPWRTH